MDYLEKFDVVKKGLYKPLMKRGEFFLILTKGDKNLIDKLENIYKNAHKSMSLSGKILYYNLVYKVYIKLHTCPKCEKCNPNTNNLV